VTCRKAAKSFSSLASRLSKSLYLIMEKLIRNPWLFRLFLIRKLPLAWIAGLRVQHYAADSCTISLRYGYWTQNPFRSVYFAAMAMAAEMSTGLPALLLLRQRQKPASMLVTGLTATYGKKAVGKISFSFRNIEAMGKAIDHAMESGEGVVFVAESIGTNQQGEEVARFQISWSFRRKG